MKIQNVKGGYDFLPKEQKIRDYINGIIIDNFKKYGFVNIENRIGECNLFDLVHISTNNSTIGEFRYHCCRLLCHELYRNHNDDGQQEYLFHFKGSLDVD